MKNRSILTFATLSGLLLPASGFAQSTEDWLPQSGVKSPYASLSVPTTLKPVLDSLAGLATELQRFRSPLHASLAEANHALRSDGLNIRNRSECS